MRSWHPHLGACPETNMRPPLRELTHAAVALGFATVHRPENVSTPAAFRCLSPLFPLLCVACAPDVLVAAGRLPPLCIASHAGPAPGAWRRAPPLLFAKYALWELQFEPFAAEKSASLRSQTLFALASPGSRTCAATCWPSPPGLGPAETLVLLSLATNDACKRNRFLCLCRTRWSGVPVVCARVCLWSLHVPPAACTSLLLPGIENWTMQL